MAVNKNYGDDATELHRAILEDNIVKAYELVGTCSINAPDALGATPLHYAAFTGDTAAVSFLAILGADLDVQTKADGVTPLHVAVMEGHRSVVEMLLFKGADKNLKDLHGCTPMDYAEVFTKSNEIVEAFRSNETFASENKEGLGIISEDGTKKKPFYKIIEKYLKEDGAKATVNWVGYVNSREENGIGIK